VAETALPINKDTLVYGSDNGCQTIHNANVQVQEIAKQVAEKLHLKEHVVGTGICDHPQSLHLAADVEGHVGSDNRIYFIDVQRLFPAEKKWTTSKAVFLPSKKDREFELVDLKRNGDDFIDDEAIPDHLGSMSWEMKEFPEMMFTIYFPTSPSESYPKNERASQLVDEVLLLFLV